MCLTHAIKEMEKIIISKGTKAIVTCCPLVKRIHKAGLKRFKLCTKKFVAM